jgi:anti-sigma regulatory factor (Ser/Thr protein kinase)
MPSEIIMGETMDTVQVISSGATALSTFGLYAICAALAVLAIHLYKRINALEKEFREALVKQAEEASQSNAELRALVTQTQEIIRANTAAFERFSNAIEHGHRGR